ncbi:MAG: GtrA family protein [Muribaculaceae bacterium]|nr:GtrA family protein [Muribaculaceae bacterium]
MDNKASEIKKTLIQLVKYGIIGVSNTLITLITFYVLNTLLNVPYVPANVTGYVLGVANSFFWNRTWVFKTKNNWRREAVLFVIGFLLCWGLQILFSWVLLEVCDMKDLTISWLPMKKAGQNIVMILSMVVYTLANYAYNRTFTFREQSDDQQ